MSRHKGYLSKQGWKLYDLRTSEEILYAKSCLIFSLIFATGVGAIKSICIVSAIYHLHLCVVYSYCLFLLRRCILAAVTVACCFSSAEVIASAALPRLRQYFISSPLQCR